MIATNSVSLSQLFCTIIKLNRIKIHFRGRNQQTQTFSILKRQYWKIIQQSLEYFKLQVQHINRLYQLNGDQKIVLNEIQENKIKQKILLCITNSKDKYYLMKLVSILSINMYIRVYKYWATTKMRLIVGCDKKKFESHFARR